MSMFRGFRWLLLAAVVVLTGCAATGPRYAEVESNFPNLRPGYGRVLVYRLGGAGAAVQPEIKLNEELIGKAQPEGFFFVDRAAGRYTLTSSTEVRTTAELELTEGATVYVQFGISLGLFVGHPRLTIQSPATAVPQLGGLAYTGAVPLVAGQARSRQADAALPSGPAPGRASPPGQVTLDDLSGLLPAR
ncbi:DUF2846 domain-containing protein [Hydrogenophaga sp.]|jgi:hypothetical protein|uniref:DUF2846 domain-containing protein n=1 Tax=Hydrogenophaga sp. TaxID=1904254 RepID=UPI003F70C1D7